MHDVIRDMALWIASEIEDEKSLAQSGVGLVEALEIEIWKWIKRLSLMRKIIENLMEAPRGHIKVVKCPKLEEIANQFKVTKFARNDLSIGRALENLVIVDLPKLKSVNSIALPLPHMKDVYVRNCPKLKKLTLNSDSAIGCKLIIHGEQGWWNELEWEDESTQNTFLSSFHSI